MTSVIVRLLAHTLVFKPQITFSQTTDSAHSAVKVQSWNSHVVSRPIVSGGVLLSTEGPVLLCALIGLPAAAVE